MPNGSEVPMAGVLLDDRAQRVRVVDEAEGPRYALYVDAQQAGVLAYRMVGHRRVLGHTEIDESYRGRGFSRVLIRAVLNDLQQRKERVTIHCPAIGRFIKQSRQYVGVIDMDHPGIWNEPAAGEPAS